MENYTNRSGQMLDVSKFVNPQPPQQQYKQNIGGDFAITNR